MAEGEFLRLTPEVAALVEEKTRQVVRSEIASLAGKALRRSQDRTLTRLNEHNVAEDAAGRMLAHFWGEVLAEYGGDAATIANDHGVELIYDDNELVGVTTPGSTISFTSPGA